MIGFSSDNPSAIAITGIGIVAPGADTQESLWQNAEQATPTPELFLSKGASEIPPLAVHQVTESLNLPEGTKKLRREQRLDRAIRLALLAASRAWTDAGLHGCPPPDPARIALVAGTSRGPSETGMEAWIQQKKSSPRKTLPSSAANSSFASLHGSIACMLGVEGPAFTVAAACSSGGHAIALAADQIVSGSADLAVAGGADAPLLDFLIQQFYASRILDTRQPPDPVCTPFDISACGTLLGEAGAFLILERLESAISRKAKIHGLLHGWGIAADGQSTSPEAAGKKSLELAALAARRRAGISAGELGYVNVHGTGTRHNDDMEMDWLRRLDCERSKPVPYSSTKPVTGHCLGAAAALEAILCIESLKRNRLPPNANCKNPHPTAPPGLVLQSGQTPSGRFAMSNSMGFWGASSSLIFSAA